MTHEFLMSYFQEGIEGNGVFVFFFFFCLQLEGITRKRREVVPSEIHLGVNVAKNFVLFM
jgi:hypothetical protein